MSTIKPVWVVVNPAIFYPETGIEEGMHLIAAFWTEDEAVTFVKFSPAHAETKQNWVIKKVSLYI